MLAGIRAAIVDPDRTSLNTMRDFDFVLTEVWRDGGMPALTYNTFPSADSLSDSLPHCPPWAS
jgi:hypothetical protein